MTSNDPTGRPGPHRTCVGCRARRPQSELIRLHLALDGEAVEVIIDRNGPGRGAWLCAERAADCLTDAAKVQALNRAFRRSVPRRSIDDLIARLRDV